MTRRTYKMIWALSISILIIGYIGFKEPINTWFHWNFFISPDEKIYQIGIQIGDAIYGVTDSYKNNQINQFCEEITYLDNKYSLLLEVSENQLGRASNEKRRLFLGMKTVAASDSMKTLNEFCQKSQASQLNDLGPMVEDICKNGQFTDYSFTCAPELIPSEN